MSDHQFPTLTPSERDLLLTFAPGEPRAVMALHVCNGRGGSHLNPAVRLLMGRGLLEEYRGLHQELRGYQLTPQGCMTLGYIHAGGDRR